MINNTVVAIRLGGGLGNMMFQASYALAFSMKNNCKYKLVDYERVIKENKQMGRYANYSDNIFKYFDISQPATSEEIVVYKNCAFHYEVPNISMEKFNLYEGYFQSEKYFFDFQDQIKSYYYPSIIELQSLNSLYNIEFKDFISIHVRRTDYLHQFAHHPVINIDYYKESIKYFGENKNYLIFSDDINWCKNNFGFLKNTIFVDKGYDYQHLYMMSQCQHNIIANSTFSWWGAWLNSNNHVICPNTWFGSSLKHLNLSDIRPKAWHILYNY